MKEGQLIITISDYQGLSAVIHAQRDTQGKWIARDIITEEVSENSDDVAFLAREIAGCICELL